MKGIKKIDFNKYKGKWYEIARLPNSFQKKCESNTTATYLLKDDYIEIINKCKTKFGTIKIVRGKAYTSDNPRILKVRFFLFQPKANYIIEYLDPNYKYVIVGSKSKKLLWILSRNKRITKEKYNSLITKAKRKGYNISNIIKTKQT